MKYFLSSLIMSTFLLDFWCIASNETITDNLVLCDLKSYNNSQNRQKLCKIECYSELGNPGFCQKQVSNYCKTIAINTNTKKCVKNGKNSRFKSICCPFDKETKSKPTNPSVLPDNSIECGERPDIAAIVGGFDTEPNTWPWNVAIYERRTPSSEPYFICGGAIINNKYILSAAHCFVRMKSSPINANEYLIKLGAYKLSDKNIKLTQISRVIPHENYNTVERYNDIALLELKYTLQFNPTVGPICLPKGNYFLNKNFVGYKSKLIGWGAKRFGGSISDTLQEVDVDIIDNRECDRNYSKINGHESGFPLGINNQFICAGFQNGGKDSCQGDSGGPLALSIDGKWYELGIVSFGYKCAEKGFPGIYTNVKNFMNWIEFNIN